MRYFRYACLGFVAIALISISIANREIVTLKLVPEQFTAWIGMDTSINVPLFLVMFGGIIAGLVIGFIWEWIREARIRSNAKHASRNMRKLERELARLKKKEGTPDGEILAILDGDG